MSSTRLARVFAVEKSALLALASKDATSLSNWISAPLPIPLLIPLLTVGAIRFCVAIWELTAGAIGAALIRGAISLRAARSDAFRTIRSAFI